MRQRVATIFVATTALTQKLRIIQVLRLILDIQGGRWSTIQVSSQVGPT